MDRLAKILTIEDITLSTECIGTCFLRDSRYDTLQAHNGIDGLALFQREHPDVVLCDLHLLGTEGLDVLAAILTESPETPVIVVTGMNRVEDAVQALRQGAWNWIPRPVQDKDMLDGVVHRALERAALLKRCREYQEQLEKQNRDLQQSLNQLEADQKEGREVQSRLLPKKECKFGNYTVTQCLYPSMYLSGDFVDYFPIGDDHIGFYIADVSGHGAASAFVTVMLKTLIDQYREACVNGNDTTILAPEQVLRRIDRALRREALDKYLTMFYAVIDRREHTMLYSNGGQFPQPILHDGQTSHVLTCHSRPLGLFNNVRFTAEYTALPHRFVLMLASDGVLELLPQQSLREKQAALSCCLRGPDITMQELITQLGLQTQRPLTDDVALLLITRNAYG